ncbi:putative RND superfamily exporter [Desulfocapsa sulfexigens DSM 10523]|uniref:Putative RND superfamily exporter n=1 Tax=Desulfocapsa sulfexigens (strain DSM 10523 / SB164P1) TaxID=1167006 RepID=M1NDE6_DESSD|nr:MMPL family transporter [Desulfocapsa sulfexigens]AGF77784.1 putative RND superfamily exporter [Desulfocapsa sulfexigens DSM 10523]
MKMIKRKCERGFGKIARWAYENKWLALILILTIVLPLISQIPRLKLDTSNEVFFRPDDRVLIDYNTFRNQFGKDEFIVIGIQTPNIFDMEFLARLKDLHHELETDVPYLDEVTSLINIRNTRGETDELIVEDFLETWPQNQTDLDTLTARAQKNSLYKNFILTEALDMTAIVIKPLPCDPDITAGLIEEGTCQPMTNVQNREMVTSITPILEKYNAKDFSIAISGMPVVIEYLNLALEKDLGIIIPATFVIVLLFLILLFRRISGVMYPLLIFILSLLSAVGVMGFLNIPMNNITTILPSFLLVVSISDAVHIMALFYPAYHKTGDKKEAIVHAMKHAGLPILMTSLTTAGGLVSFMAAKVAPIADLGVVTPVAVFLALIYTILLIPALFAIFPVKRRETHGSGTEKLDLLFERIARLTCCRQGLVISLFAIVLLVAAIGVSQVRFEHNALKWFPENSTLRKDTELIDQQMRGTVSFDVVIDTGRADGLYDSEFIKALEKTVIKFSDYTTEDLYVGKVLSLITILKETNRALHENSQEMYTVPDDRKLIAQELFLFQLSGSDDLDELVDQQFSKTRLTMHVPYRDTSKYKNFMADIEMELHKNFPDCTVTITGINALFVEILNNVMSTMIRSYSIALILISLLMIIMLGKLRMGLLSMIPNLFPIIVVIGLMGWLRIPLDLGTVLIGSITIGLVVDDTIHFLHNFGKYFDQLGDPALATARTLKSVGRAMMVTSFVLAGGFLCNMLSKLTLNKNTGILVAATILIALITDFLLAPAILSLVYTKKKSTSSKKRSTL